VATINVHLAADGSKTFRARVRVKGHPTATKTFRTKTAAKNWAARLEQELRDGGSTATVEAQKRTLADAIDRYRRDGRVEALKESSRPDYRRHLAWWREQYGGYILAALTPAVISEAKAYLAARPKQRGEGVLAPASVAKALRVLSTVLDAAHREWHWIAANPASSVKPPKVRNARTRFLDDAELQRLLETVTPVAQGGPCESPDLRLAVLMALTTGARKSELFALTRQDLNLGRGTVTFRETKNGTSRTTALVPEVVEAINARPARLDTTLLFPSPTDPSRAVDLRSAWETALRRAGIEDFRWHDLRHSAASYLAMSGASLAEIAAVLGHKTLAMVARYSHLSEEATATASRKIAGRVFGR
jgi:integrase